MRAHQQGISPRLRGPHTRRRIRKDLHPRSSVARRESFCPLDKDLSWKSGSRRCPLSQIPTHNPVCPSKRRYTSQTRPMKKLTLLPLALLIATTALANSRNWKPAKIDVSSETSVSSKLLGEKNTMRYTIETEDMIYFVEYIFKTGHADSHPPNLTETE